MRDLLLSVIINTTSSTSVPSVLELLLVYPAFVTPEEFADKCKLVYKQLGKYNPEDQQRVVELVYLWLGTYWNEDFQTMNPTHLLMWAQKRATSPDLQNKFKLLMIKHATKSFIVYEVPSKPISLVDLTAEMAAEIITSYEFQLFHDIPRREFMHPKNRPNIDRMITHFNNMASHIATEILTRHGEHQRVLEQWIQIGVACWNLGNFNAVMEVIAGLTNLAIARLHDMWKAVPEKLMEQFKDLEVLMDCKMNYANYRRQLSERKSATVPYLGIYLRDLIFTKEGNPERNPTAEINDHFVKFTASILSEINKFQGMKYPFKRSPLGDLRRMDEEELYELSEKLKKKQSRFRTLRHSMPSDARFRAAHHFTTETVHLLLCMLHETTGVPLKKGDTSKMYFAGNELIDWIVSFRQGYTREAAVTEAQEMYEQGLFKSVCPFMDAPYKYYWTVTTSDLKVAEEPSRKRRSWEI